MEISEVTIKDIWPHLCDLGVCELRINERTVWSDSALDVLANKDYYNQVCNDYLKCAEDELLGDWWENFRVTKVNIKITDFHHCIASIIGYYKDNEIEGD